MSQTNLKNNPLARFKQAEAALGLPPASAPVQSEIAQDPAPASTQDAKFVRASAPPPPANVPAASPPPPARPAATHVPPVVHASPEVLAMLEGDEALLALGRATLALADPSMLPQRAPRDARKKMPKNRTGTLYVPYPRQDGRETIKTSFNFDAEARRELDAFFAVIGMPRRNLWTEQVLLRAARAALKAHTAKQKELSHE
jgi:hypothetical protein